MTLSRRHLLAALGLALPSVAMLATPAQATTTDPHHKKHHKHGHNAHNTHTRTHNAHASHKQHKPAGAPPTTQG